MVVDARDLLSMLAAGVLAGLAMYGAQFLSPGSSLEAIQVVQVQRALVSTAALGLAGAVSYLTFDGEALRDAPGTVFAVVLLAGLIGYAIGFGALWMAPPDGFSVGSTTSSLTLVVLQEVIPFSLAGFAGAAVRSL